MGQGSEGRASSSLSLWRPALSSGPPSPKRCRRLYVLSSSLTRLNAFRYASTLNPGRVSAAWLRHWPGHRTAPRLVQPASRRCRHDQVQLAERVVWRADRGRAMAVGTQHAAVPAMAGRLVGHAAASLDATPTEPAGDAGNGAGHLGGADRRPKSDLARRAGPGDEPEPREQKEDQDAPSRHGRETSVEKLRMALPQRRFRPSSVAQSAGPIIFSGRTRASNSASSSRPKASAAVFRVVPSACAFLATLAALS